MIQDLAIYGLKVYTLAFPMTSTPKFLRRQKEEGKKRQMRREK